MEPKNQIFQRKLLSERIFLGRPANYAIMVARIQGDFSKAQLRETLSKLRKKHPLLATRIIFDESNIAWLHNEGVPEIPIVEIPRTKEDQWIDLMIQEHHHVFPIQQGPLIRIILVKGKDSVDLIINSYHAISDGLSLAYLIRDILETLSHPNGIMMKELYPPQLRKENIPGKGNRDILTKILIKLVNKFWTKRKTQFTQQDYKTLTKTFWAKNTCQIIAWQLNPFQTSKLITLCKEKGVTVNTALLTAFLLCKAHLQDNNREFTMKVHMPIDIRDRLKIPAGEAFGFYAQTLHFKLNVSQTTPFWKLARKFNQIIHSEIQKEKNIFNLFKVAEIDPDLLDSTYYQKYGLFENKWSEKLVKGMGIDELIANFSITNIGNLPFSTHYGDLTLEAIYGPSVILDIIEQIVGVATIGGKLNILLTFDEKFMSKDTSLALKRNFMELLGGLCDWKN